MNLSKVKKAMIVLALVFALLAGPAVMTSVTGFDFVPNAIACGSGSSSGGGAC